MLWRLTQRPLLVLLLGWMLAVIGADVFDVFEKELLSERGRQAVLTLSELMVDKVEDRPKEIEITIPGDITPQVTIRDLVSESASAFNGAECMKLKLTGKNFNFQLSVSCEDIDQLDMRFDGGEAEDEDEDL